MRLRFRYFSIIGALVVVGVLSVWYFYAPTNPAVCDEGFEQGLGDWVKDADLPLDPNNPGHFVAWNISRVNSLSFSGQYSLELFIDGRADDGTIWIEKEILGESDSQIHVTISFEFYSEAESFNTIAGVCAYVGISNPTLEEDFVVIGLANEVAGWKRYTHEKTLTTGSTGKVWVALGITVRWETEMTYNIDDVKITMN
jgi:hypothetical protein